MNPTEANPTDDASDNPLSLVRPSWADPSYLLAASAVTWSRVTVPAGVPTVIAPGDPRRYLLHVSSEIPSAGTAVIGPTGEANSFGLAEVGPTPFARLSLFEDGPLVCLPIYAYSALGCTLLVVQTRTN